MGKLFVLSQQIDGLLSVSGWIFGVVSFILTIYFYMKTKLTDKEIEIEKIKYLTQKEGIHWHLQAMHHACNRLENIIRDPKRNTESVVEVARSLKDSVNALMGQVLGKIHLFQWNNYPIIDPMSGKQVGVMVDSRQYYNYDWREIYKFKFGKSWEENSSINRDLNLKEDKDSDSKKDSEQGNKDIN